MPLPKAEDELHRLASAMNQMTERLVKTIQTEQENARALDEHAKALMLANAKANEAIRTERDFIATMSHELRTPLNAIIGYSDLMLMATDLSPKERTRIESIRNSGSRLLYLINELLDMSKIEAGRLDLRIAPFSPTQLANRLTTQLSILAETRKLAFHMDVDPALPEQVLGDEARIEQIITNLLGNAFKFTDTGSVVLTIRAHQPDQQWSITVTDTGAGIPPEAQELIFEKYRRVEMQALSDKPGTGLGLPITRNLVELMGGVITLESQPGIGSTFTVRLPMIIAKAAAESTEAKPT
jgi:signal transduction histidine kinase